MSSGKVATVRVRNKMTNETALVHGGQLVSGVVRSLPRKGTTDLLRAYSESPMLQAVARKIASSMSAATWVAKARMPGGDMVVVDQHIAERMINSGVPGLDGVQCRMFEQLSIELVGESFAVLDRNAMGVPYRRWPIPPHWVSNTPQPMEEFFEVRPPRTTPAHVSRDDMLWHKDVDPYEPYMRGVGVARGLADELSADEAAARHVGTTLLNRARPDLIVSGSKEIPLNADDARRLAEVWTQRFMGPDNAGKPFVSAAPITVEQLTPSFRELQLTNLREFERDIIIAVFGVPPEIMGVLENSNRSTIESSEYLFAKHVLRPRLIARRATYNEQLAWQYDDKLFIDFVDPVEENRDFTWEVVRGRPRAFTDDEVRSLAGMAPLPNGEGEARGEANEALSRDPLPSLSSAPSFAKGRASKIFDVELDDILSVIATGGAMLAAFRAGIRGIIAEFGAQTMDDLGVEIDFDMEDPDLVDFIARNAAQRSDLINGTTRKELRRTLAEGIAAGEPRYMLVERILNVVEDATESRANLIATTETTRAAGYSALKAMQQAGITRKEWLAVRGSPLPPAPGATRDTHREGGLDGQTQPLEEPFISPSGATAMYPGDFGVAGEDIACRCVVVSADSLLDTRSRDEMWEKKDAQLTDASRTFARMVRSAFREQGQAVIEEIERRDGA